MPSEKKAPYLVQARENRTKLTRGRKSSQVSVLMCTWCSETKYIILSCLNSLCNISTLIPNYRFEVFVHLLVSSHCLSGSTIRLEITGFFFFFIIVVEPFAPSFFFVSFICLERVKK